MTPDARLEGAIRAAWREQPALRWRRLMAETGKVIGDNDNELLPGGAS
jgi:hypothetical protein